tara:strand:+ start:4632 stop:5348 length:717 start_codon:yes stop_codon:yes gene_type:complete
LKSIICIDIGNTNIVVGRFLENSLKNIKRFETSYESINDITKNYLTSDLIAISSVVPKIESKLNSSYFRVSSLNSHLNLNVNSPDEVGNDRICNMKAAIENNLYPSIIVDFGSATTYDVIDKNANFLGGAIAPGIDVSAKYLFEKAEQLEKVKFIVPKYVIGKNTETNLQSGIMYSGIDAINGMISRIKKEMHNEIEHVILTGGFSKILSKNIKHKHSVDMSLTLKGIKKIWDENNKI